MLSPLRILLSGLVALLLLTAAGTFLLHLPISRSGDIGLSLPRSVFLAACATTATGLRPAVGPAELTPFGQLTLTALLLTGAVTTYLTTSLLLAPLLSLHRSLRWHLTATLILLALTIALGFSLTPSSSPITHRLFTATSIATACGWRLTPTTPQHELLAVVPAFLALLGPAIFAAWLTAVPRWPDRTILRTTACLMFYLAALTLVLLMSSPLSLAIPQSLGLLASGAFPHTITDLPPPLATILHWLIQIGPGPTGLGNGPGPYLLLITAALLLQLFRGTLPAAKQRTLALFALWLIATILVTAFFQSTLAHTLPQLPEGRRTFLITSSLLSTGHSHDTLPIAGPTGFLLAAAMLTGKLLAWSALLALTPQHSPSAHSSIENRQSKITNL